MFLGGGSGLYRARVWLSQIIFFKKLFFLPEMAILGILYTFRSGRGAGQFLDTLGRVGSELTNLGLGSG